MSYDGKLCPPHLADTSKDKLYYITHSFSKESLKYSEPARDTHARGNRAAGLEPLSLRKGGGGFQKVRQRVAAILTNGENYTIM